MRKELADRKMIVAIKPFEIHDGDGIRTTVFLKGCPMRCKWCHNPEAISHKAELSFDADKCVSCGSCTKVCDAHTMIDGKHIFDRGKCTACGKCEKLCPVSALKLYGTDRKAQELAEELAEDKVFFDASGGGVTISGGEPFVQTGFVLELLKGLKERGINTAIDTCGYTERKNIDSVLPYTDTFLYDLKAFDEDVHIKCTNMPNRIILDNLRYIDSKNKKIEIRIPYVPGMNDNQIEKIGKFIKELKNVDKVRVLPFHGLAVKKYLNLGMEYAAQNVSAPTEKDIETAITALRKMNINAMKSED